MNSVMKNIILKSLITGLVLAGSGLVVKAQSTPANNTVWASTKGVQKIANKQLFEDKDIANSHIRAMALSQTWMISKGVHNVGRSSEVAVGNISSPTTSQDWTISKGVHRVHQNKKDVAPTKELFKTGPEITRENK